MNTARPIRQLLFVWGIFALAIAAFSAYDATRARPTDGAYWLLGGDQIVVFATVPGGPAEQKGMQAGDVVEAIGGQPIRDPRHAARLLQSKRVGEEVMYLVRRDRKVYEVSIRLGSTRLTDVRTYLVYCSLGLVYFIAGAWIVWRNRRLEAARLFYILCTLFLIYFFAASDRSTIYYWSDLFVRNVGTFASLMVPPLFLHFFLVFPERRRAMDRFPWLLPLIYALPLAFYLQFSWEQLFGLREATVGALEQMALGIYFTAGLASLVSIYVGSHDPTLRQRVKFLTLGTVLGTLPFLVFNIALGKLLGRTDLALLGAVPMVLVPVSFGYSIARYRLMDIEVIIRRSLIYAVGCLGAAKSAGRDHLDLDHRRGLSAGPRADPGLPRTPLLSRKARPAGSTRRTLARNPHLARSRGAARARRRPYPLTPPPGDAVLRGNRGRQSLHP